jgi:cytochrome c553
MKVISFPLPLQTAILAIVFSTVGHSADIGGATFHRGALQAKIQYCTYCHGSSGRGYRGYFPMPRLAGQTTEYFESQLRAFAGKERENLIALNMSKVHGLSPAMRTALATHFEDLEPKPLGGGPRRLLETGKKIFEEGIPETNVPACSACHGPDAMGEGANPRLAGQLYPYTVKELVNWSKERGQQPATEDTSNIMAPIAHSLTKSQIEAVAAYLSDLK